MHNTPAIGNTISSTMHSSNKKGTLKEWLENTDETSIWTVNCIISGPSTDGRRTRIPPMMTLSSNGRSQQVMDNKHKGTLLFKMFFPSQGVCLQQDHSERYPPLVFKYNLVTNQQIRHMITKISPYKASGLSNVVFFIFIFIFNSIYIH